MESQDRSVNQEAAIESMDSLRMTIRTQAAALQTKGRLIDNMAYQIRTLSNAVVGFSDLLLTEQLTDDQRDYADEINRAGKGLSELVNEVLDWAQLGSGRLQLERSTCEVLQILEQIRLSAAPNAEEKGLVFGIHHDEGLPASMVTDVERLLKCLINLVANAIAYTEQGYIKINAKSDVRDQKPCVRFDVIDSGPGIAPQRLATLFEPSVRQEDASSQAVMMLDSRFSAAAGLPLTRQLAELLGGHLEVQSEVGKGSVFSLLIPTGTERASATLENTSVSLNAQKPQEDGSQKILLVEDQESNRTVVRLMLQSMGFDVDTAMDGQEGVEMATAWPYGLILMDLKMPRMNGYDAARCLREKQMDTPIVALTAMSVDPHEKKTLATLFDGFLIKPVDCDQLLATANTFLKRAATADMSAM